MPTREEDRDATRQVRSIMARRGIDVSRCDLRVTHGVCYVRGLVQAMKGVVIPDLKSEMDNIAKVLRQKQDIREVVMELTIR